MKKHVNDLQVKGEQYEELPDQPMHQETGGFFLSRYRQIDQSVTFEIPKLSQALRVNTLKVSADDLMHDLNKRGAFLQKIPFLAHGYYAKASFSLGATPEYLLGKYYLQAPLSQLVSEILKPSVGATVLDMAAAPGSKTTHLATLVGPTGTIFALDNDATRLAAVRNNVERLGLTNVICIKKDARFAADLKKSFSFVLLDAPCSGNFCSEENWFGRRKIEDIKSNARTQRELMRAAYLCLAPGGRMVYSTCSLEPEEDELVVDWALSKFPDLQVIPIAAPVGDAGCTSWAGQALNASLSGTKRCWPHKTGTEGFYIALLERR